jgi:hypothetical protein
LWNENYEAQFVLCVNFGTETKDKKMIRQLLAYNLMGSDEVVKLGITGFADYVNRPEF